MGDILHARLVAMKAEFPRIVAVMGKGLVAGVVLVKPGSGEPDGDLAFEIVRRSVEKGVLLFSPVGFGGGTVKICPPLMITEEALTESADAFHEAVREAIRARSD
jgi:4-aminobutyrate aminotransferase-like enzyme